MERKPLSIPVNITVTGASGTNKGSGSNTTPSNSAVADAGGYMKQIVIHPPHDTDTYDYRIVNVSGHIVFLRTGLNGDYAEDVETPLPAGTYACYISEATNNGVYAIEIIYAEVY